MLRNLIFGQYVYKKSLMHEIDPRIKVLSVLFLSIVVFLAGSYFKLLLITFFILVLAIISRIQMKIILKNLRPFLFVFVFIFLMYFLFSRNQLDTGIVTIWRFVLLIVIASILTFSTTISSLVLGLEKLLLPLKIFRINTKNFAVMISITIRFIPLFFMKAAKLRDAIISRLGNLKRIRHIKIFILSLLDRVLRSASNLSDAMESRCYSGNNSTYFKELELKLKDMIVFSVVIVILIFIIY